MKKSLMMFVFVFALSTVFALGQASTVGQSTDNNTKDHSINPEQAQTQDMNSGKSSKSTAMVDDQSLHRQIHEQLSSSPAFQNVQVEVENGTAKLSGTVASKDDKKKAKEMAKSISGVKKVKDDISVNASMSNSSSGSMNQSSMGAASSADQNTAGSISGNAGSSNSTNPSTTSPSTTSPSTPDSTTTPNSTSTPNSTTPPQTASADTAGAAAGTATAAEPMATSTPQSSTATPDASSPAAGSVAAQSSQSSTTGTQSTAAATGSSDQVKSDVQTALRNEPTLSSSSIMVDVSDDSIQLSGTANSAKDRDEAKRIAQSFAGNRRVVDNIKVSGSTDMSSPSSTSPNAMPGSSTPGTTPNSTATPNSTNPEQPSVPKK